eukprot:EG_transcript_14637
MAIGGLLRRWLSADRRALGLATAVAATALAVWKLTAIEGDDSEPRREAEIPAVLRYLLASPGPSGYGSGTTAERVAADFGAAARGKVAVVTGCTGGIGKETALQLSAQAATVVMGCRDVPRMRETASEIRQKVPHAVVYELELDLASQKSVQQFVENFAALELPCDLLINNAGVMACPRAETEDGFEKQLGTNHLGHFALTNLIAPYLSAAPAARVVNVASEAHRFAYMPEGIRLDDLRGERKYSETGAYGQSKLANILHARELNRRFATVGIPAQAYSVHPGVIATDLWRYQSNVVNTLVRPVMALFGKSIPQGAATTVFCALAPDLPPGYYYDCNRGGVSHPCFRRDPKLAQKLWDASVELTHTDIPPRPS